MHERARMSQKIDLLIHNRDALTRYIEALDTAATRPRNSALVRPVICCGEPAAGARACFVFEFDINTSVNVASWAHDPNTNLSFDSAAT